MTGGDWEKGCRQKLRKFGPRLRLPQECEIEDDLTLDSCTFCVVVGVILFMGVYALWFLTLTEVQPASIWVAPQLWPEVSFRPTNRTLGDYGDYCDHPEKNSCLHNFAAHPKGDGVFIPTVWGYEEVSVRPSDGSNCKSDISAQCEKSRGHGGLPGTLGDNYYCNCKKNESFFIPWVVEQNMMFSYHMHLQIPDLDVMDGWGINTPYCQGYLQDKFLQDPPIWTGCKGQNDVEWCLRNFFYVSSMPCQVRFNKRAESRQKYNGLRYKDLSIDYFWTDLWGLWHLDVSRVLHEVVDFNQTNSRVYYDPRKCFISTGGSFVLQHLLEPAYPRVWHSWWSFTTLRFWKGIGQKIVCRIGSPWLINLHHSRTREWPCFRVRIDITYLPLKKYEKTETDADISQSFSTTKTKRHRGLAILAQGGVGKVRQFSWTAIVLGVTSLASLWAFRLTILKTVISLEFLCRGQASDLYRKALTQKVSLKRMVSAWVCRSVSALEAADRLATEESRREAARKLAEHLRKKFPKTDDNEDNEDEDLEPFLLDVIENMIRDGLNPASPTDGRGWAAGWWHANEVRGELTSKDITELVEDGEEWEDLIDPSFKMVAGKDVSARVMQVGYAQMCCRSKHDAPDDSEAPEAISMIDPQISQLVHRKGGAE